MESALEVIGLGDVLRSWDDSRFKVTAGVELARTVVVSEQSENGRKSRTEDTEAPACMRASDVVTESESEVPW